MTDAEKLLSAEGIEERAAYYSKWGADIRAMNGASDDADHSEQTAFVLRALLAAIAALQKERDEEQHAALIWEKQYDCVDAQYDALRAQLDQAREALRPLADWSRLEALHGSTIGHADIPDDTPALLVVGDLQTHVGTAGSLRALAHGLSRAKADGGNDGEPS